MNGFKKSAHITPWVGVNRLSLDIQVVFCHNCWAFVNWLTRPIEHPGKKDGRIVDSWDHCSHFTFPACLQTQGCGECHQWTHKLFSWHQFLRFPQTPGSSILAHDSSVLLVHLTCTTALLPDTSRTWPALGFVMVRYIVLISIYNITWSTCVCHQAV